MLPLDSEFSLLYLLYLALFIYVFYSILKSSQNRFRLIVIAVICILLNLILYSNVENFKGGGSLVVLFYSVILLIVTLVAVIVNNLIFNRKK